MITLGDHRGILYRALFFYVAAGAAVLRLAAQGYPTSTGCRINGVRSGYMRVLPSNPPKRIIESSAMKLISNSTVAHNPSELILIKPLGPISGLPVRGNYCLQTKYRTDRIPNLRLTLNGYRLPGCSLILYSLVLGYQLEKDNISTYFPKWGR